MEPVFISAAILLTILLVVSYYVTNGIGDNGCPNASICFVFDE